MAYLGKARKEDLILLAQEIGENVDTDFKIIDLKNLIVNSKNYEEEFVKEVLSNIIEDRKSRALQEENNKASEIEKLKLELEAQKLGSESKANKVSVETDQFNLELRKLLPIFNSKEDDMGLFLNLFERQLKFFKVPDFKWVAYLIGVLPTDVAKLIARESDEQAQNYEFVKNLLLQRFKLTADKFRQLFSHHRKSSENTWRDFYFELRTYFEGWISELGINDFKSLKDLVIADQIKKRTPPEVRDHFIDEWANWNSPCELAEKLDAYDNIRNNDRKDSANFKKKFSGYKNAFPKRDYQSKGFDKPKIKSESGERTSLTCYGCGNPGYIKAKCPNCSKSKQEQTKVNSVRMYTCLNSPPPTVLLDITIYEAIGAVCADTGATRSVGGESVYKFLMKRGQIFKELELTMQLADGKQTTSSVLSADVPIKVHERTFLTNLIFLPHAKGNRTLLGVDFLQKSGIVLDIKNNLWYFSDKPRQKFLFAEEDPIPDDTLTNVEVNSFSLRENEGESLNPEQKKMLNGLLCKYEKIFQPGGEATPYAEHRINTGDSPPVSMPPYRMTPARKEILKKEIDNLIAQGIIEECESPYASPVILVPKPDGSMRLCVDYRKLNAVTVPDTYPLPRMDDLLHEAKHTSFMSTLDLRSGYHQIRVYPPDQDKTAFVCPFGTFRYLKMPFGLRNAPAEFQRMIDKFINGLKNVFALSYLDDIVLSDTFENHISDLQLVFERLIQFKLNAKREKCHFACSRVKYLGHYITPNGLQMDPDKVSAIDKIPTPKNVREVQSFLQTCSWYRRFIPNFAEISRCLSNLTKKRAIWKWGSDEEKAFRALKDCLITPPVLRQADGTKPFTLRTDASSYALGAILLQKDDHANEHPIEYASRLLTNAEKNYSTTEREALAVIWALGKFRGYVEGQEIIVATDHQPLKWLLSLKSPSGRLARWALQLQSYNLKIEYIPGKANVVADMLSRPSCEHPTNGLCQICSVVVDIPVSKPSELRSEQLKDEELKKIIKSFENDEKSVEYYNWTERGYVMNQGILYRYSPSSEAEEAQLVVPSHEREKIMKEHHDSPTAGHYGAEGTLNRISKRYYWTGMRSYIANYVKNCVECNRYKPSNQKPSGLLQTPVYSQRFEVLSIDLFGPLPESKRGKKWILIVEDCSTKWVELFALTQATAKECATTLLEEVILRYGLPRRLISDNGSQFVSGVMQQLCYLLDIKQSLIPVYHPQANPVERKNRDLKPRLAILVGNEHDSWEEKLPTIRFAMNTAKCDTTGETAAFLQFGRELRTIDDVQHDIRAVIFNDNFVPEITPYLKRFANMFKEIKERVEAKQDQRKKYADRKRQQGPKFSPGDKVWVNLHPVSKASSQKTAKFMPKRDGPYIILTQRSPSTFEIASLDNPDEPLATYHSSALKLCHDSDTIPVVPIRKRGRPPKKSTGSLSGRQRNQRGRL